MRPWARALVLAASPGIAVGANVLRLAPTVWAYGHWDSKTAGLFHDVTGWGMLIASFLALVGIERVFRWALPDAAGLRDPPGWEEFSPAPRGPSHSIGIIATFLLLIGAAWEAWKVADVPAQAEAVRYNQEVKSAINQAPIRIGSWSGRDVPMDDLTTGVLQPNLLIHREYADSHTGRRAKLLLVQVSDARRIAPHSAPACYDFAGWELTSRAPHDWPAANLVFTGTEYEFYHGGIQQSTSIAVADFFSCPMDESSGITSPCSNGRGNLACVSMAPLICRSFATPRFQSKIASKS